MKNWLVSALVAGALVCPVAYAANENVAAPAEQTHSGDASSMEKSQHEKHHHAHKKHHSKKKGKKKCHHKPHHDTKEHHADKHSSHEGMSPERRIEQEMEKTDHR